MKLINRKTNEMACFGDGIIDLRKLGCENVAEMIEAGWEDCKEPKEYWYIAELCGGLQRKQDTDNGEDRFNKQIGNYFETEEEAEKAVEKFKAWKRLKDKGFQFDGWSAGLGKNKIHTIFWSHNDGEFDLRKDLDLLFGGEE